MAKGWCNGDLICSASGDGSIQLWNINHKSGTSPAMCYKEHAEEIYSIDCNRRDIGTFISSSWDCTVKLWDNLYSKSLSTFHEHSQLVYQSKFSPLHQNTFASVSGDGLLKIWNMNCPTAMITVQTQSPEVRNLKKGGANGEKLNLFFCKILKVISCDWNPTNPNVIATGGSEGLLKLWDLRHLSMPLFQIFSGDTAIRKIRYSRHSDSILTAVSYDGMTRIWDLNQPLDAAECVQNHMDSVFGLDWNPIRSNQLVDCGWDSFVQVFRSKIATISN